MGSNATYVGMNGLLGLGSYVSRYYPSFMFINAASVRTATAASSIMLDLQNSPVNSNTFLYNASRIIDHRPEYADRAL